MRIGPLLHACPNGIHTPLHLYDVCGLQGQSLGGVLAQLTIPPFKDLNSIRESFFKFFIVK